MMTLPLEGLAGLTRELGKLSEGDREVIRKSLATSAELAAAFESSWENEPDASSASFGSPKQDSGDLGNL